MAIVEDVRGPKGSLTAPRSSVGHLVGISCASYLVYSLGRGTVHQAAVRVLNKISLLRSGLPTGLATEDSASQTFFDAAPPAPPLPTAKFPRPAASQAPPTIDLSLGSRVEVKRRFKCNENEAWYLGTVVESKLQQNGLRRHLVEYDGEQDGGRWRDFASTTSPRHTNDEPRHRKWNTTHTKTPADIQHEEQEPAFRDDGVTWQETVVVGGKGGG